MPERVVVTGAGVLSSLGTGRSAFLDGLLCGRTGFLPIAEFDTTACRTKTAARLRDFNPAKYIDPAKLRRIDAVGRLAIAAGRLALDDAGWKPGEADRERAGVVLGTYTAGLQSTVEFLEPLLARGPAEASALIFSNTVGNAPASLLALEAGLLGPNVTLHHKESSSLAAVAHATGLLLQGRADLLLVGGADDLEPTFFRAHDRFRAMSPRGGGEERCRPFDRRRNGLLFGDGAYVIALERETAAAARGARLYGEVLGIGATASPVPVNAWPVDPRELARAMLLALEEAGRAPADVDLVLAAANGTPELDRAEALALAEVFGPRGVPVTSIKGAIGESACGGAASLLAALLALGTSLVPPTAGLQEPDPELAVDAAPTLRRARGRTALVNSFGSGGTNYAALVRAREC